MSKNTGRVTPCGNLLPSFTFYLLTNLPADIQPSPADSSTVPDRSPPGCGADIAAGQPRTGSQSPRARRHTPKSFRGPEGSQEVGEQQQVRERVELRRQVQERVQLLRKVQQIVQVQQIVHLLRKVRERVGLRRQVRERVEQSRQVGQVGVRGHIYLDCLWMHCLWMQREGRVCTGPKHCWNNGQPVSIKDIELM